MKGALLVAAGGALGALARYGVTLLGLRWGGDALPWGTWAANGLGCLLLGLALPLVRGDEARLLVLVGTLGAFTTFSTYSAETVGFWEAGRPGLALANAAGSVLAGVACVAVGLAVGRQIAGA